MAASAQETTSTIRGTVTTGGAPVAGATVTVTDTSSGTRAVVTSNENGAFIASGLRPGGPYTVDVASAQGNVTRRTSLEKIPKSDAFTQPSRLMPRPIPTIAPR